MEAPVKILGEISCTCLKWAWAQKGLKIHSEASTNTREPVRQNVQHSAREQPPGKMSMMLWVRVMREQDMAGTFLTSTRKQTAREMSMRLRVRVMCGRVVTGGPFSPAGVAWVSWARRQAACCSRCPGLASVWLGSPRGCGGGTASADTCVAVAALVRVVDRHSGN